MAVNRPRRPRQPRRITPQGASPAAYARAAERGMDFVAKLEAIADARRRQAAAPPIHTPRPAPSEQRSRRMPTAGEMLSGHWDVSEPAPAMPSAAELLGYDQPFAEPVTTTRMPTAQELLDGIWDPSTAPDPGEEAPGHPGTEYYSPTRSICPPRPRTLEMSYNRQTDVLRVVYRDGGTYDYFNVPGPIWYRIRQVKSPGRFINRNIKGVFEYEKVAM